MPVPPRFVYAGISGAAEFQLFAGPTRSACRGPIQRCYKYGLKYGHSSSAAASKLKPTAAVVVSWIAQDDHGRETQLAIISIPPLDHAEPMALLRCRPGRTASRARQAN